VDVAEAPAVVGPSRDFRVYLVDFLGRETDLVTFVYPTSVVEAYVLSL
jgi:hypothetical protein